MSYPLDMTVKIPKVGDTIYVPTAMYVYRGSDDFAGGRATVSRVYEQYGSWWVAIKERPGTGYNWASLGADQENLAAQYGDQLAHPDPDDRPEFNDDGADWRPV